MSEYGSVAPGCGERQRAATAWMSSATQEVVLLTIAALTENTSSRPFLFYHMF